MAVAVPCLLARERERERERERAGGRAQSTLDTHLIFLPFESNRGILRKHLRSDRLWRIEFFQFGWEAVGTWNINHTKRGLNLFLILDSRRVCHPAPTVIATVLGENYISKSRCFGTILKRWNVVNLCFTAPVLGGLRRTVRRQSKKRYLKKKRRE